MGLCLIAFAVNWQLLLVILEVAIGLGMVIFVHELGHFAVAKLCGVKCEKFYLGFDIYGLKLAHFQWGETEYGIGILPLGGYVKMLGQDDNPARAAQERERSRVAVGAVDGGPGNQASPDAAGENGYALDPRSYMAKSVPQRMAIISAGVVMNIIFAVVMAIVAYSMGVKDLACGVSAVYPGEAAWRADLHSGDMFIAIDDSGDRPLRYRDLMSAVAFADMSRGVNFEVVREGVAKSFVVNVKPDLHTKRLRPTIGVNAPRTAKLSDAQPVAEGTPADEVDFFKPGDQIVAIGDARIHSFLDVEAALAQHPGEPLKITVEHKSKPTAADETPTTETAEIAVPPRSMRTLGLVMKMGKITAVQANSPAAKADIRPGDFITAIDGQASDDPMRLGEELRRRAGQTVTLSISRDGPSGQDEKLEKHVALREPEWSEQYVLPGSPASAPALGIAYKVLNIVHRVEKGSPAARAALAKDGKPAEQTTLASGDEIVKAEISLPDEDQATSFWSRFWAWLFPPSKPAIEFSAEKPNWPSFIQQLQRLPEGTTIKLTLKDGREATMEPVDAADWYDPDRGLVFDYELTTARARSATEAVSMGCRETVDAVRQVYLFLGKIGSQVSPYMLGGPKTIAEAAGSAAYQGVPELLIFLTMLSANLAVINFLPIPLLDGGHMVFLILEGILRRPVSEKVVVAFHYLGFVFIISLMLFVLGLDFGLIPRPH